MDKFRLVLVLLAAIVVGALCVGVYFGLLSQMDARQAITLGAFAVGFIFLAALIPSRERGRTT